MTASAGPRGMRRNALLAASAALLAAAVLVSPAGGSPTGPDSVRPGKNVSVFHGSDFVGVYGYELGEEITVDLYRGDRRIATASGPAVSTDAGFGLEVNHGPLGTPLPGDCWEVATPDVRPGDRVVVTDPSGTDSVFVDGITIDRGPVEVLPDPNDPAAQPPEGLRFGDVVLQGRAAYADGAPIPLERLDSAEFRVDDPRFEAVPSEVVRTPGTEDGWTAIYRQPYEVGKNENNWSPERQKQALLSEGTHSVGYGHVEGSLPPETQLAESPAANGPAPGCEVAPANPNAITTASDRAVNIESGGLTFGGTAADDVVSVNVALADGDANTPDVTGAVTGPGNGAWSAEFSREQLDLLGEGTLTATATFARADGATATAQRQMLKDLQAPGAPAATPGTGHYNATRLVALRAPEGESGAKVRYTTDGAEPTATTGRVYRGEIEVRDTATIKALVVDAAGNPGPVASFSYTIDRVAPGLTASVARGSYDRPFTVVLASSEEADIFYTLDGSDPSDAANGGRARYDGAGVGISRSAKLRAVAVDPAGNRSAEVVRDYVVRAPTALSLNLSTKTVRLGASKAISGRLTPAGAGRLVRITVERGGRPVLVRDLRVSDGRYALLYKPRSVGRYSVSVSFAKDADNLGSRSKTLSFRVVGR